MEDRIDIDSRSLHVVTFAIEKEWIGLPVADVLRIEPVNRFPITRMPRVPDVVEGIINYRGDIFPLINGRRLFGLERIPYDENTTVVMVVSKDEQVGFVVDNIPEARVLTVAETEDISRGTEAKIETELISCVCEDGEHMVVVLDVDALLRQLDVTEAIE